MHDLPGPNRKYKGSQQQIGISGNEVDSESDSAREGSYDGDAVMQVEIACALRMTSLTVTPTLNSGQRRALKLG